MRRLSMNDYGPAIIYRHVVNSEADLPATYAAGWGWIVGTAGTYRGKVCEPGDILIAIADDDILVLTGPRLSGRRTSETPNPLK